MRDDHPRLKQMRRDARKIARRKASRQGMPAILIVCEGRETEPNYIRGLCDYLGINRAAVQIECAEGVTDPGGLVRKAQQRFASDGGYDRVFVVCDGDTSGLAAARELARKSLRNAARELTTVQVIASHPSFEYWLLLHFEYRAAPCAAAEATRELRRHLTGFVKAEPRIFEMVEAGLDLACERADQLKRELAQIGASVPDTDMAALVRQLIEMKRGADENSDGGG
jgi:hypothetical protein